MASSTGGEFRGKTVEEAIEAGLDALGLKRNQADVEILNRGSRGLLGFGAEEARVSITPVQPGQQPGPAVDAAPDVPDSKGTGSQGSCSKSARLQGACCQSTGSQGSCSRRRLLRPPGPQSAGCKVTAGRRSGVGRRRNRRF